MTAVLGISAFYHDSAAAIVVDGELIAAAQEERFTRIKHDASFPRNAIDACLKIAGLTIEQLDHVSFYEKPLRKFDRLLETYLSFAPAGFLSFFHAMPRWVGQKLRIRQEIRRGLDRRYAKRMVFCEHHQSHAASAFFPSPFEEAAILTMDGVGEWATSTMGVGRGNRIELTHEQRFPHSLGLLYSAFTYYTGFRVNSGEYKLMGLAPYGEPVHVDTIKDQLIDLHDDGSFWINLEFFNYCQGLTMTSRKFAQLFGRPPRTPETPIESLDMDLAASIQVVTEEIVLRSARHLHRLTGQKNLCLAGGVALNCVANGRLARESPFDAIWIQPAAGDAGGAAGAAWFTWYQLLKQPRDAQLPDAQKGSLLGPCFHSTQVQDALDRRNAVYRRFDDDDALADMVARLLADGKIVGRFSGPMEFGPRALGNRSILADPRGGDVQSRTNLAIKMRESFRPFAPAVIEECAGDYFEIPGESTSPYMLFTFGVHPSRRKHQQTSCDQDTNLSQDATEMPPDERLRRVGDIRSDIPAVTHVDYSARVQTVDKQRNPGFRKLLDAFHRSTGCPVLVNTSFNVRGEPIVATPEQAYRCFMATGMDVLVVENFLLLKEDQPEQNRSDAVTYIDALEMD